MGKISINLTDSDKQALQQEAKKQKKSLSELCRERILNVEQENIAQSVGTVDDTELMKKLTTLNKNLIVLFNEIKSLQLNQNEIKKQVYYNSSYLYFLTHELFADNPEMANNIDKKIQQLKTNSLNNVTTEDVKV